MGTSTSSKPTSSKPVQNLICSKPYKVIVVSNVITPSKHEHLSSIPKSEMSAIASAPAILRRAAVALNEAAAMMEAPLIQPVATTAPSIGSVIPSISGYQVKGYDKVFNQDIVYRSANGDPLYGTIGVSWWVHEDLRPAAKRLGNNRDALIKYVMNDVKRCDLATVRPTKVEASQLVDIFLFFNNPAQEFFFIKKGTSCQWLVRKTTRYFYESEEGNAARGASAYMPHRVGYEVIRKATAEESANQLGRGIQTWMQGGMKVSQ